ncbi:hypothetical protein LOD99_2414 [Oopsacas minuta]|uniref:DH domain-containing protein n=1 Tax=Oopsacas minuta TaxID=111878 RepID=A0AAV7K232_9METZ|nr:hypothetical protein LOD99_2414 [Oopsacas minuta]
MSNSVSWHWLWLSEQDSIWQPKCVERGWFLHYSPLPKQYGAWKQHYVACLTAPPSGVHLPITSQHIRHTPSTSYLNQSVPIIQQDDWDNTNRQVVSESAGAHQHNTTNQDTFPFYLSSQKQDITLKDNSNINKPWLDPDPHPQDLEKGWNALCDGTLAMHRSIDTQKHGSLHPSTYSSVSRAYSKASAYQSTSMTSWRPQSKQKRVQKLSDTLREHQDTNTDQLRPKTAPASTAQLDRNATYKPVAVSELSVTDTPWYKAASLPIREGEPLFYSHPSLYYNSKALVPATRDLHYYVYPHTDYCSLARGLPTLYHPRLLLLPSTLLSWQLLAAATQPDTLCLVFNPRDITLPSLTRKLDSLLAGRIARSIAVFSPLASNCMPLHSILAFGPKANLVDPNSYVPSWEGDTSAVESSDFLSFIRGCILPPALGSRIDIFSPSLPADKSQPRLHSMSSLSKLVQLPVSSPSSVTALYSLRNEEWIWVTPTQSPEDVTISSVPSHTPPSLYFVVTDFLSWCHLAESATNSLRKVEKHLSMYLRETRSDIMGTITGRIVHHALALGSSSDMIMMTDTLRPILLKYTNDVMNEQLDTDAFSDDIIGLLRHGEDLEEPHPILAPEVWPAHLLGPNAGSWHWFEGTGLSQRICYPMLWGHNLTEWGMYTPPKDRRGRVLWEWFHTELTYNHMLHLTLHEYQKPLKEAVENSPSQSIGLTSHELDIIFSDIQLLSNLSTQQLAHLEALLTHWDTSSPPVAAPLLLSLLSSLTIYKNYIFNYPALTHTLNQGIYSSGRLRVFLRRRGIQPYTNNCSLPILLLAPLQRIRSIYQLLSSLISITPDTHPDVKEGGITLARLTSLLTDADSLELRASSERELVSLSNSITGCPVLFETGRQLYGSWRADLMVGTRQNGDKKIESIDSLKIYLFTDALLISRVKLSNPGFSTQICEDEEFVDSIGLNRVRVCEANSEDLSAFGCEIKGTKKVWKVAFLSQEDRVTFFECFASLTS